MSLSPTRLRWVSAAATDTGRVRQINEDAVLERADVGLWAVADGMGGHKAGDLASSLVVQALQSAPAPRFMGEAVDDLRQRLAEANRRLRAEAAQRGEWIIGSTLVALLVLGDHCVVLWVGDSRVYRLRRHQFRQLTRDHSHVEELIEQGLLSRRAAESHPAANVITRALGADDELQIDTLMLEIQEGDRFLLCSDGLTKEVPEQEIAKVLATVEVQDSARALITRARDEGARDNVTAVVVQFSAAGSHPKSTSRRKGRST